MSRLVNGLLLKFSKIHTLHSIPGRVRVKVPGLDQINGFLDKIKDIDPVGIFRLKGVKKMEFSYMTSKVLIHYDNEVTSEKEILNWLNCIRELLIAKAKEKNTEINQGSIDEILSSLKTKGFELE